MKGKKDVTKELKKIITIIEQEDCSSPVRKKVNVNPDLIRIKEEGCGHDEMIQKLSTIAKSVPSTSSKQFFNQLFGGRNEDAFLGDCVASYLNNSMYTRKVAGNLIDIEEALLKKMCEIIGFENGGGVFTPGGSLSNLMGMLVSKHHSFPESREKGMDGRTFTVYTSEDGHYSTKKNAGIVGIGRNNVKAIQTDEMGRMIPEKLNSEIENDLKNGKVPIMINATAGTTIMGSFDPLGEIADIAKKHGIWMHVDGAFGGSLLLSSKYKKLMKGIERCDSMTWDAHKLMNVPLTCSAFLIKDEALLIQAINESAEYLYQSGEAEPGMKSIQCGRKNDVLKLWCVWIKIGDKGFDKNYDKLRKLVKHAVMVIRKSKHLRLSTTPESLNVCFEVRGIKSESICEKLETDGNALVGHGVVNGEKIIRLSCVNPSLTKKDINLFFKNITDLIETNLQ